MPQSRRKIGIASLVLLALAVAAVLFYQRGAQRAQVQEVRFLMNTFVEVELYGPGAQAAADELFATLAAVEEELSWHRPDSALSRVNAASGEQPVALSEFGYGVVSKAKEISQRYPGYDATIAPLTGLWDITGTNPRVPAQAEIETALALVDWRDIQLDSQAQTVMLARSGQALDLGGILKGASCALILPILEEHGVENGYVSLGGNLLTVGENPREGKPFRFGVRDPFGDASQYFGTVQLPSGSVMATAGGYERYFEQDGVRYHHILDPSTGYPAESDLVSVTVISRDGALADALSTALFVGGTALVRENLQNPDFELIAVDEDRQVYLSAGAREWFTLREGAGFALAG